LLFYDPAYPLGTIYFYYVPDQADTIYLNSLARLQSSRRSTTQISLPPGYEELHRRRPRDQLARRNTAGRRRRA
jgi:hypothetical protein